MGRGGIGEENDYSFPLFGCFKKLRRMRIDTFHLFGCFKI